MLPARPFLTLLGTALLMAALWSAPSRADSPCANPGMTVVVDPAGDVDSDWHDIVAISMAEIFGGTHAGKFRVTLDLAATAPPDSEVAGLWLVDWREFGGDSTMTLSVSRCRGSFVASYTWQSADGQYTESGPVDDFSVTPGRFEFVLSRDKFGDPPPGAALTQIAATTLVMVLLPAPLACAPTSRSDQAGTGTYVMGNCSVSTSPRATPPAIALGPAVPNPARAGVRLTLSLPRAMAGDELEVTVLDTGGRRVRTLSRIAGVEGWTPVEWDLREENGRRVAPGNYWLRVHTGAVSISRVVTVLR